MTGVRGDLHDDVSGETRAAASSGRVGGTGLRARLSRWSVRQLVGTWVVYWFGLLVYKIWPELHQIWVLSTTNQHGTVSLSFSGDPLDAALWIAGPPLLLALVWIATRPPRVARRRGGRG